MKILKNIALSFLSFLLFLSLTIFGIVHTVKSTALNPDFVTSEIDALEVSELIEEFVDVEPSSDMTEMYAQIEEIIPDIEPIVKESLSALIHSQYDYLLGKTEEPALKAALGDTFLNAEFVGSVLDKLDLPVILEEILPAPEGGDEFSEEFTEAIISVVDDLESDIKQNVSDASGPILDYLVDKTDSIDLASTLRSTILTEDFALDLIDKIAIFSLASESLGGELTEQIPEDMAFLVDDIDELMPEVSEAIEQQIGTNIDQILDYLVGQRQTININISLADAVANLEDSIREHLKELPPDSLTPLIQEMLTEQITQLLPAEVSYLTEDAITSEWIYQQTETVLDPVLSYMLGERTSLNVTIQLEPVLENLKDLFKTEFLASPPPELAGLPSSAIEAQFDDYYQELMQYVPSSIVIDKDMLGADLPAQVDQLFEDLAQMMPTSFDVGDMMMGIIPSNQIPDMLADVESNLADVKQNIDENITEVEDTLEEARKYISYFQLAYTLLLVLIGVIVVIIAVLIRNVKGITRRLGIPLFIYGALEYAGLFIAKNFIPRLMPTEDMPAYLETWIFDFIDRVMSPLQIFSLILLIIGVVLIVVSFVYRRGQPESVAPAEA
ncbi:hypothetical protein ACFLW0_07320 [Chloroflexota bacterium]